MQHENLIKRLDERIQLIKRTALEMKEISCGIQAVDCNVDRILSSAKMLEINISDAIEENSS